jgi:hypothetical protein
MLRLQVCVSDECPTCDEAYRVVAEVIPLFPHMTVEMIQLSDPHFPANVFAVPTYLLDGRIIFLGNPTHQELSRTLVQAESDPRA